MHAIRSFKATSARVVMCCAAGLVLSGGPRAVADTGTFSVVNSGTSAYVINGSINPDLTLVRGSTYSFNVNAPGHPFRIKTIQGTGTGNAYNDGVTGNGTTSGTVTFSVPTNAPSLLYYNCQYHSPMTGELNIEDPSVTNRPGITFLDVSSGQVDLAWTNGFAPFQVQWRPSLTPETWSNLGSSTTSHALSEAAPAGQHVFLSVLGSLSPTLTAEYRVTFTSTWSAATHPTNFPSPDEHYSSLVGGTHSEAINFWGPGAAASPGIENMAETGGTSPLSLEINSAITAGKAEYLLLGGNLSSSPGSVDMTFDISTDFPLVTLVTMIAPSPDWFVGVHDLNLLEGGDWAESLTVSLPPYDAGTDDGMSYTSSNADSNPQGVIQQITGFPLEYNGEVAPFGNFVFERIDNP